MKRDATPQDDPLSGSGRPDGSFRIDHHPIRGETAFAATNELRIWSYVSPTVGEVTVDGAHYPRRVYHPGDMRLTNPGSAIRRTADDAAIIRCLTLSRRVVQEALGAPVEALAGAFAPLQSRAFRSPLLESLTEQLRVTSGADAAVDAAYVEALLHAASHELRRLAGLDAPSADGRLCARELKRLNQFIDGGLADKLQLRDLAGALRMPVAQFQRALKRATGRTAYQHLIHRRLTAARGLIEGSDASLAQIAFQTGFTSQSHMTDVFKAKLGATPSQFRPPERPRR